MFGTKIHKIQVFFFCWNWNTQFFFTLLPSYEVHTLLVIFVENNLRKQMKSRIYLYFIYVDILCSMCILSYCSQTKKKPTNYMRILSEVLKKKMFRSTVVIIFLSYFSFPFFRFVSFRFRKFKSFYCFCS